MLKDSVANGGIDCEIAETSNQLNGHPAVERGRELERDQKIQTTKQTGSSQAVGEYRDVRLGVDVYIRNCDQRDRATGDQYRR